MAGHVSKPLFRFVEGKCSYYGQMLMNRDMNLYHIPNQWNSSHIEIRNIGFRWQNNILR